MAAVCLETGMIAQAVRWQNTWTPVVPKVVAVLLQALVRHLQFMIGGMIMNLVVVNVFIGVGLVSLVGTVLVNIGESVFVKISFINYFF